MVRRRWGLGLGLLFAAGCGPRAQTMTAKDVVGVTLVPRVSPTAAAPSRAYVVPDPTHLKSDELRCQRRALTEVAFARTIEDAMSRVETVSKDASRAPGRPIYLGVRQCGSYRAVTMGDRHQRAKLVYDESGALIAAFASQDVLEQKCLVGLDDATVHYGRAVDCTESELLFPAPATTL